MAENGRIDKTRLVIDIGFGMSLLGLAFAAGSLNERVNGLTAAVNTPGGVRISIEASTRLTALETNDERQDMRLTDIERQLRRSQQE